MKVLDKRSKRNKRGYKMQDISFSGCAN